MTDPQKIHDAEFFIPGVPVVKARPKITRNGNFTPAKSLRYEQLVSFYGAQAMQGRPPFTGPLKVDIMAIWSWPKSMSEKKRKLAGSHWKITRPDRDNLDKIIGDGGNQIVWADDSQIVAGETLKQYGATPGVRVTVERLIKE